MLLHPLSRIGKTVASVYPLSNISKIGASTAREGPSLLLTLPLCLSHRVKACMQNHRIGVFPRGKIVAPDVVIGLLMQYDTVLFVGLEC